MTRSADLRELIALEQRSYEDDGGGGAGNFGPYTEQFRAWARIEPLRGGEEVLSGRLTGRQPVVITVRWHPQATTVDAAWRVRHVISGALYDIKGVANMDEVRRFIEILAEGET